MRGTTVKMAMNAPKMVPRPMVKLMTTCTRRNLFIQLLKLGICLIHHTMMMMMMMMMLMKVSFPAIFVPSVLCLAYPFCSYVFIVVNIAETVKQLNQSLASVLDEVNRWLVKPPPAQNTVIDSPSASRCRRKMRSLEAQLNKCRCGIGQDSASGRWGGGASSVVSEELPSLVNCEEPDESDHSQSQRSDGLEVHYKTTAAENGFETPRIVGLSMDGRASMGSTSLETSFSRLEECCDTGPNAFRSREANEIELPTVPDAEFTQLPGTDLAGSVTSFQMPKADYLEVASPVPIPAHRRASMGSALEDDVKSPQGFIGKWRRSSLGSMQTPIKIYQMMRRRDSPGTMNGSLASPGSVGKRRPGLDS